MTQEEKAERYDEAIAHAKNLLKTIGDATLDNLVLKNEFEKMFPELKESEDERIRKALIYFIKQGELKGTIRTYLGVSEKIMLTWIEKQNNQSYWKPSDYQMSCLEDAITSYKKRGFSADVLKSLYDDLKKLKE